MVAASYWGEVYAGLWCAALNLRYAFGVCVYVGPRSRWRLGAPGPGVSGVGVGGVCELYVGPQAGLG